MKRWGQVGSSEQAANTKDALRADAASIEGGRMNAAKSAQIEAYREARRGMAPAAGRFR